MAAVLFARRIYPTHPAVPVTVQCECINPLTRVLALYIRCVFCCVCGLSLHVSCLKRNYSVVTINLYVSKQNKIGILGFLSRPFTDPVAIFISSKIVMKENRSLFFFLHQICEFTICTLIGCLWFLQNCFPIDKYLQQRTLRQLNSADRKSVV